MEILKQLDFSEIEKQKQQYLWAQAAADLAAKKLRELVQQKAAEYYGNSESCKEQTYFKENEKEFTTEDGYTVKTDTYQVRIIKELPEGKFEGRGTRYDKQFSDLTFYIGLKCGREGNAHAKKYTEVRERMEEIADGLRVHNPFKEYEELIRIYI